MTPQDSDVQLLKESCSGNEEAFSQIYRRHRSNVFGFAYRMLGSRDAAEEVTQECFLSLVRCADRYDSTQSSLGTYLYAITRNLCCKRCRRSTQYMNLDDTTEEPSAAPGPLTQLLEAELSIKVASAIAALPHFQREVVVLFEFEGLALAEIAIIVAADIGAVKSRLHRARQQLRKLLAPYVSRDSIRVAGEKST